MAQLGKTCLARFQTTRTHTGSWVQWYLPVASPAMGTLKVEQAGSLEAHWPANVVCRVKSESQQSVFSVDRMRALCP